MKRLLLPDVLSLFYFYGDPVGQDWRIVRYVRPVTKHELQRVGPRRQVRTASVCPLP
ncbi:hypothetical protein SAMN05444161_8793 [Rhizobiales bacterium GAS191]|nr:hypothetical protein SAMN05444161_8793 [Rhizobiales bacterium GAS191]